MAAKTQNKQTAKNTAISPEAQALLAQVEEANRLAAEAAERAKQLQEQAKAQLAGKVNETLEPLEQRVKDLEVERDEYKREWDELSAQKKELQARMDAAWAAVEKRRELIKQAREERDAKAAEFKAAGLMAYEKRRVRKGKNGETIAQ